MTENDILNSIDEQLEEAREKAEAEGRAEGRAEVIRLLHSKGMSIEQIAGLLEIDPKEIEVLV